MQAVAGDKTPFASIFSVAPGLGHQSLGGLSARLEVCDGKSDKRTHTWEGKKVSGIIKFKISHPKSQTGVSKALNHGTSLIENQR